MTVGEALRLAAASGDWVTAYAIWQVINGWNAGER